MVLQHVGDLNEVHLMLKQITRDAHCALEAKLSYLLSDDLSLDEYTSVQKRFYGFYRPIEMDLLSICGWDDPELKLRSRLKIPLLINDLAALAVDRDEIVRLPVCSKGPHLESISEALGCLYVLEGSTLGGKIITRHLKTILPLDEGRGFSFFNSYGDDVGRMWSSFLGVLTRHCERKGNADIVIRSACQTFSTLDWWLSHAA